MTGYDALRKSAALIDLAARGKIRATGEDRARLLHAMSTNHVQDLAPRTGQYTFFLSEKGRILSDAYIYNLEDALFLDTEPEARHKLFEHLDRFIIADDVVLEDETEVLASLGLEGPESLAMAVKLGIPVSETRFGVERLGEDGFSARTTVTGAEGWRLFFPAEAKGEWIARFEAAGVVSAEPDEVRTVRLEQGRPRYGEEITERYLVQETQADEAVHSNKGCYLGQEIVERVRSRGQVHRLLTPIQIAATMPPTPGVKIVAEGAEIGEIVSAALSPAAGEAVGFAYLRAEALRQRLGMSLEGTGAQPAVSVRTIEKTGR